MSKILLTELPKGAFLKTYEAQPDTHTDCYKTSLQKHVSLEGFINAFFTSWLFRIERLILRLAMKKPSSDYDIAEFAKGTTNIMAAWETEQRDEDQILLQVPHTPIRTWLMRRTDGDQTHLYFGSAILPVRTDKDGKPALGRIFVLLMGFHRLYARALLYFAERALR